MDTGVSGESDKEQPHQGSQDLPEPVVAAGTAAPVPHAVFNYTCADEPAWWSKIHSKGDSSSQFENL